MFIGRAGVIGYLAKKKYDEQVAKDGDKVKYKYILDHEKKCKYLEKENKYSYIARPWSGWIFGVLMLIFGVIMMYLVTLGNYGHLFSDFHEGFVWQYMIAIAFLMTGIMFLLIVTTEQIEFNKQLDLIIINKYNVIGYQKTIFREISKIDKFNIIRKGHFSTKILILQYYQKNFFTQLFSGKTQNTIHYLLRFNFENDKKIEIFETGDYMTIKKLFVEISILLSKKYEYNKIDVENKSTNTFNTRVFPKVWNPFRKTNIRQRKGGYTQMSNQV